MMVLPENKGNVLLGQQEGPSNKGIYENSILSVENYELGEIEQ